MAFRKMLPALLLASLVLVPAAEAKYRVGIGEQSPSMYDSARWQSLQLKRSRYMVPWTWNKSASTRAAVVEYMNRAHAAGQQVLVAFKDVEDQLAGLRLLEEQSAAQARAVESAARSTALSEVRYRNGYVSQLDLLDAQRSELRNRRQALQVRSAQYQSTVALVRALGGGWD